MLRGLNFTAVLGVEKSFMEAKGVNKYQIERM